MDKHEYERRQRQLDRQLEAGIEILRSAHRTQRHALDLVWLASPENREAGVLPFDRPLTLVPEPSSPPAPAAQAPPGASRSGQGPAAKRRWRPGELRTAIVGALAKVPQEFDRNDLVAALGAEPERGSLYRIVEDLRLEGVLTILSNGRGQTPSRYRKLF